MSITIKADVLTSDKHSAKLLLSIMMAEFEESLAKMDADEFQSKYGKLGIRCLAEWSR